MERKAAAREAQTISSADWLFVAVPGIIWGASFLFIAEGLRSVAPNGVTFTRVFVGFAALALFPGARKSVERSAWPAIALLGFLWFALPMSMFPFAEQRVSSALTGMLNAVTPLFVAIVATAIARKAPSRRVMFGLLTGLAGSVVIALPSVHEGRSSTVGVTLILIASASYGFAQNLSRPLQLRYGALPVIWRALGVAAALTAPLGVPAVARAHWMPVPLFSLLTLGVFGTGIAFVMLATATGRVGATRASAAAFLMPPVSLALGIVVRNEHVAALSIVGSAICVAGAWMIRPRSDANPEQQQLTQLVACPEGAVGRN
jgi:drug/metabolite transporter (DMT)-like permease